MYIYYKRLSRISYRIQAGHPKMASNTGEAETLENWLSQQSQSCTVGWRTPGALLVFSTHTVAEDAI